MNQINKRKGKIYRFLRQVVPDLEDELEINQTVLSFLSRKHDFAVEPNGTVDYRGERPRIVGRSCKLKVSQEHGEKYLKLLEARLRDYISLMERNSRVCRSYQVPKFEISQAEKMAEETFSDSFVLVRDSYNCQK